MTTQLTRPGAASDFYQRAETFLVEHEAAHNLMLGLASNLMRGMAYGDEPPYFVTVEDDGAVVGTALRTPPFGLVLSLMRPDVVPLIVAEAYAMYPDLSSVHGPGDISRAFAVEWQRLSGRRWAQGT